MLTFLYTAFIQCGKDEITSREYPRLNTLAVSDISENGAKFNAEIMYRGDFEIINYGFVWGERENPIIENSDRVVYLENIQSDKFSSEVSTTLKEEVKYYLRSFIQTAEYTVYGSNVEFISLGSKAPQIVSVEPLLGTIGDTITIRGKGFSYLSLRNTVYFDTIPSNIIASSDSIIKSTVPKVMKSESLISVSILGNTASFSSDFKTTIPIIESFRPTELAIDDTLTIVGENFSYEKESNLITIDGVKSKVIFSNKVLIKAIIPSGIKTQNNLELTIANKKTTASRQLIFLEPSIISVKPSMASFGDTIVIEGENFSFINESNGILVDATKALVISSSKNKIQFILPENINKSQNTLRFLVGGRKLTYDYINILPPIINSISPNYISTFDNGQFELLGENFNSISNKNSVMINGIPATISSSSNNRILLDFPRALIPHVEVSVLDTVDISIQVLDQNTSITDGIIVDYKSIWTRKKDFPGKPRMQALQFSANGKVYVGLGESGTRSSQPTWEYYNDLWEYDPILNIWTQKASLPAMERSRVPTLIFDTKIYIVGGTISANLSTIPNEVWEYDVLTDAWTQKNDFPGDASSFGFTANGKGYIGGGENGFSTSLNHFWEYDPTLDSWTQKQDHPKNIHIGAKSGSFHDYGFAISDYYMNLWKYDHITDNWTDIALCTTNRVAGSPFVINEKLYLAGGSILEVYDRLENTCEHLSFMGNVRTEAAAVSLNGKGYILLGRYNSHSANLNDVWEFDPSKP